MGRIMAGGRGTVGGRVVADRREALVLGAFRLIAERGFEGLRLREVAAHAGIDHSTLHHYFPTKQDLVAAVVGHATDQFRQHAAPPGVGSPAELLRAHLRRLAELLATRPELFVVLRELDLRATRDPAVRAVVDERERGWHDVLAGLLGAAGAGPVDPRLGAALVIATVKGTTFASATAPAVLAELARLLTTAHREES